MIYYNSTLNKYYAHGSATLKLEDGSIYCGVPTPEILARAGYEEFEVPIHVPTEEELNQIPMDEALNIITGGEYDR